MWESASVPYQGSPTPTPKESAYQQSLDKTIQEDEELNPSQHGWKKTLGVWVLLLQPPAGIITHPSSSANVGSCYLSKGISNSEVNSKTGFIRCLNDVPMLMRPSVQPGSRVKAGCMRLRSFYGVSPCSSGCSHSGSELSVTTNDSRTTKIVFTNSYLCPLPIFPEWVGTPKHSGFVSLNATTFKILVTWIKISKVRKSDSYA